MTLEQINKKLGQKWFKTSASNPIPGLYIIYAEDDFDVRYIEVEAIFKVEKCTEEEDDTVCYIYEDNRLANKRTTPINVDSPKDMDNFIIHSLNKWQIRGCLVLQIK